jgi:hypothetical protein
MHAYWIILCYAICLHAFLYEPAYVKRGHISLGMSSLDLSATPSVEDWLGVCDPGLKRTTLAMFRACKEIAYKIRTASCNKMACFNEFGKSEEQDLGVGAEHFIMDGNSTSHRRRATRNRYLSKQRYISKLEKLWCR